MPLQKIPRNLRPFIEILLSEPCSGPRDAASQGRRLKEPLSPCGSVYAAGTGKTPIMKKEKVWLLQ
jgi:hypothetical protein